MTYKPVNVFIEGELVEGWTDLTLNRSKEELTGKLDMSFFFTYVPPRPVMVNAARGRKIAVYIYGNLAFRGILDSRTGSGVKEGEPGSSKSSSSAGESTNTVNIGPDEYTVKLSARGMTKTLVDSSQQHPTGNMMQPTTRQVVDKLLTGFQIEVEWLGVEIKLDKMRFRDGARVINELRRISSENGYFIYETRDGKLRVTDGVGVGEGPPLVLGHNVLRFSADQSEDAAKSEIKVKGQITKKEVWGEAAVLNTIATARDQLIDSVRPLIIQHYGNGDQDSLKRRAQFEANKRSSACKKITIEVFHVSPPDGDDFYDIGKMHYVEIPPEGVFDVFECTGITYSIQAKGELKTTLELSPPPTTQFADGEAGLSSMASEYNDLQAAGNQRRLQAGVSIAPGNYPAPWSGPSLIEVAETAVQEFAALGDEILYSIETAVEDAVPLVLPDTFRID